MSRKSILKKKNLAIDYRKMYLSYAAMLTCLDIYDIIHLFIRFVTFHSPTHTKNHDLQFLYLLRRGISYPFVLLEAWFNVRI